MNSRSIVYSRQRCSDQPTLKRDNDTQMLPHVEGRPAGSEPPVCLRDGAIITCIAAETIRPESPPVAGGDCERAGAVLTLRRRARDWRDGHERPRARGGGSLNAVSFH